MHQHVPRIASHRALGSRATHFGNKGQREAQGTSQGHKANRDISLKGRCLPCGKRLMAESIASNMPPPARATSLPCPQRWGGRRVGYDGASPLWLIPGSPAETGSPSSRLQAHCSAALPGNGLTSVPLTPSGRGATVGVQTACEHWRSPAQAATLPCETSPCSPLVSAL